MREPRREAPRRNIIESQHTEAAPPPGRRAPSYHQCTNQRKVKRNYQFINQWVTESVDDFAMHGRNKGIAEKYKK